MTGIKSPGRRATAQADRQRGGSDRTYEPKVWSDVRNRRRELRRRLGWPSGRQWKKIRLAVRRAAPE